MADGERCSGKDVVAHDERCSGKDVVADGERLEVKMWWLMVKG